MIVFGAADSVEDAILVRRAALSKTLTYEQATVEEPGTGPVLYDRDLIILWLCFQIWTAHIFTAHSIKCILHTEKDVLGQSNRYDPLITHQRGASMEHPSACPRRTSPEIESDQAKGRFVVSQIVSPTRVSTHQCALAPDARTQPPPWI